VTLSLANSKNKDRSLAAYVISFLAASLAVMLAIGHTDCYGPRDTSGISNKTVKARL
jgi:hypothetical protein